MGAAHSRAPPINHFRVLYFFYLEGVSEAEIDCYKVVRSQIGEVITNFAENPNVGSKAIFGSATDVPEDAIRSDVLT
jgi:hypothetical protein